MNALHRPLATSSPPSTWRARGFAGLAALSLATGVVLTSDVAAMAQVTSAPGMTADAAAAATKTCVEVLTVPMHGSAAAAALDDEVQRVADRHGMTERDVRTSLARDPSLWVDRCGRLFYVEPAFASDATDGGTSAATTGLLTEPFGLHSRPGADRVIYLDFNGETISGTAWNANYTGGASFFATGFNTDGNPSTFSASEEAVVASTWARVADAYSPFDVDVTTEDPGLAAIDRSSSSDSLYGTRALITNTTTIYTGGGCGGCAGVAYVGTFNAVGYHEYYQPAFIFQQATGGNARQIALVVTHEVGHNLNLRHDGTSSTDYYGGHGAWGPIMGSSWSRPIVQWSKGEYAGATDTADDLAMIANTGAPLRADDHGGSSAAATSLGMSLAATGVITTRADTDWFSFTGSGATTISVTPAASSPTLDASLALYDAAGSLLAQDDPASARVSYDVASGLSASITTTLPAGDHFARVDGVGTGDPLTTGYSDYASLGRYSLSVSTTIPVAAPTITRAPAPSGHVPSTLGTGSTLISWAASAGSGPAIEGYDVRYSTDGNPYGTSFATVQPSSSLDLGYDHRYQFQVRARDVAGGSSGWVSGPAFTPRVRESRIAAMAYVKGTWSTEQKAAASGGSTRWSRSTGARVRWTFTGRAIAFVTTQGPTRGRINVYIDGAYVSQIDGHASTARWKRVLYGASWASSQEHTIELRSATSGARMDVDAFVVYQ